MGYLLRSAHKDALRLYRDPVAVLLWIGIPLAIGALISLAFGGGGSASVPRARVLLVDREGTFLGGLVAGALSNAGGLFAVEEVAEEEGRAALARGEATSLVVLPGNFSEALLLEEPATIEVLQNPAQRILPRIVEETVSTLPDLVFYVHRLIGEDLRAMAAGPDEGTTFPDERIAEVSVRINRLVERLQGTLFPPVVDVEVVVEREDEQDEGPQVGFALLFLPGILVMSLMFVAQGLGEDLWREDAMTTLRRAAVAPHGFGAFLGGKLLAGAGVVLLVSAVFLGVGCLYLGVPLARWPAAAAWGGLLGTAMIAAMFGLQLVASSQKAGNVLTMMIVFPLLMIGGSFFPFEAMPGWMGAVGRLTPNGWALEHLKAILLGRADATALLAPTAGLVAAGAACFAFSTWRLRARYGGG